MAIGPQSYRLDRRFALQFFGWRVVLAGIGAMATFFAFGLGGTGRTFGWVFLAGTVILVGAACWMMARPPRVISLDAQGLRIGRASGSGSRRIHWTSVEKVTAEHGLLRFEVAEEAESVVHLTLVGARANELQREVHERLNTAHGYRRLN